ncbi:MAG: pyrroline-5-carboxylate reductase [Clostridiales bacterium]|jgi:pyrroline-5-carboxylate reductase|nr:pyrroline-5-carboxylate reductase [Clostridiales bacterium]
MLGFIGAGNITSALISGAVASGVPPEEFLILDINPEAEERLSRACGVASAPSLYALAGKCDIIFLAVKPNNLERLLPELKSALAGQRRIIVSVAASRSVEYLTDRLGAGQPIARVMPNLNASVGEGVFALCGGGALEPCEKKNVMDFLNRLGLALELDECYFPAFSAIAGSGPAFVYLFVDSLARAGLKNGINKETALRVAAQTVLGSAKTLAASDKHPWEHIDNVCSPGGLTVEGVSSLQNSGFEASVIRAVDAVIEKDKRIAGI